MEQKLKILLVLNVFHVYEHISSPKGIGYPEIQGLLMVLGVLEIRGPIKLSPCLGVPIANSVVVKVTHNLTWL